MKNLSTLYVLFFSAFLFAQDRLELKNELLYLNDTELELSLSNDSMLNSYYYYNLKPFIKSEKLQSLYDDYLFSQLGSLRLIQVVALYSIYNIIWGDFIGHQQSFYQAIGVVSLAYYFKWRSESKLKDFVDYYSSSSFSSATSSSSHSTFTFSNSLKNQLNERTQIQNMPRLSYTWSF